MSADDPTTPTGDDLVAEQEAAAAAEAAAIGGPPQHVGAEDPSEQAVLEAGGGEAEGFELAEHDLIENATHGDGRGDPLRDAFAPEAESDRSGATYGEADHEESSEVAGDDR